MRELVKFLAAGSLVLFLACCAPRHHAGEEAGSGAAGKSDSLGEASLEELFFESYGELLSELEKREEDGKREIELIEARSIMETAERVYLDGNTALAIELIEQAEQLLRRTP